MRLFVIYFMLFNHLLLLLCCSLPSNFLKLFSIQSDMLNSQHNHHLKCFIVKWIFTKCFMWCLIGTIHLKLTFCHQTTICSYFECSMWWVYGKTFMIFSLAMLYFPLFVKAVIVLIITSHKASKNRMQSFPFLLFDSIFLNF